MTGLTLTAASLNVNETATGQLAAWQLLDDATFLAIPAASVTWSVASSPLTGISTGGLATAGTVYQNTAATAQGIHLGQTGTLGLTVLESIADNFGTYAGDSLSDDWQFQHFGLNNPNAAPLLDPDGDGHNNFFEYNAGIIPTDNTSKFSWRIDPVPGFTNQKKLTFGPRLTDRTYTVEFSTTLTSWQTLTSASIEDSGLTRTVTDTDATAARKFYRVRVSFP